MNMLTFLFLTILTLFFGGCISDQEEVSGAENFPNTFGMALNTSLEEVGKSNLDSSLPENPTLETELYLQEKLLKAKSFNKNLGLTKLGLPLTALDSSVTIKVSNDTSIITLIHTYPDSIQIDTLWSYLGDPRFSEGVLIRLKSLTKNLLGITLKRIEVTDQDGNGFVGEVAGIQNQRLIRIYQRDRKVLNRVQIVTTIQDAGKDDKFGEEGSSEEKDNHTLSFSFLESRIEDPFTLQPKPQDTLAYTQYLDANGDGNLWENQSDSVHVWIKKIQKYPSISKILPDQQEELINVVYFPKENSKSYYLYYREKLTWNNLTQRVTKLSQKNTDSVFTLGDTLKLSIETSSMGDSLSDKKVLMYLSLGENQQIDSDNRIFYFEINSKFQRGPFQSLRFQFTPTQALLEGQEASSGSIVLNLVKSDSTSVSIQAELNQKNAIGTYREGEEKAKNFNWKVE